MYNNKANISTLTNVNPNKVLISVLGIVLHVKK